MYRAPVADIAHALKHVAGVNAALDAGDFGDLTEDVLDAVLEEAGRFATDEIAPLRKIGDTVGAKLVDGAVVTPPGWRDLYRKWIDAGWAALAGPVDFGGQGLPTVLSIAALEMWNSGAMAFGVGPTLTMGAAEALDKHASAELKAAYLEKLVSGEWMGTMNLTEPQAGTDLAALKSRAEPRADGTYRIFGQKIFITYGEHDWTDNIVHLVLARLPDAPPGVKGISLFLAPKFLVNADGSLGDRNDVFCSSLEHKLGIHGSPTCVMIFGDGKFGDEPGAVGWLVGEENRGLACMFTMMNNARLAIGIQGVAVAEAAYQKALVYASERKQGRAAGAAGPGMSAIVDHADVRRNLATMRGLTAIARALCYSCAFAIDRDHGGGGTHWRERAALLTPLAKAFSTDIGVEAASIGLQVHGGMGFIEETGAAMLYRDARIAPIYEGTNGIQAIDLVTRKLPLSGGDQVRGLFAEMGDIIAGLDHPGLGSAPARLAAALVDLESATAFLLDALAAGRMEEALAGATPYLRLFSLALGATLVARGAAADGAPARIALARFVAENLLSETAALRDRVVNGAASLAALAPEFAA